MRELRREGLAGGWGSEREGGREGVMINSSAWTTCVCSHGSDVPLRVRSLNKHDDKMS